MEENIVIFTDGGSRGNPGPSACGFVVEENGKEIYKGSKYLGHQTNNFAEYSGVVTALEWLITNHYSLLSITFFLDSELVVKQLNGLYKIKNDNLKILSDSVHKIISENCMKVIFKNVPREKNKVADQLVNDCLDKNIK